MKGTCETCKYFEQGKWHDCLGGGEQEGGFCKLLPKVLNITNSSLWSVICY